MAGSITAIQQEFIEGMSRIGHFWGFPKALGAIFGALYLSPESLSLDELCTQVGVSKGTVSTNVRYLERLGMVHKQVRLGERRDFYTAEADFWKIIKGLLQEREKGEFDRAIRTVDECLESVETDHLEGADAALARHYQERLRHMQGFFRNLDNLVAMLIRLDQLRLSAVQSLFRGQEPENG